MASLEFLFPRRYVAGPCSPLCVLHCVYFTVSIPRLFSQIVTFAFVVFVVCWRALGSVADLQPQSRTDVQAVLTDFVLRSLFLILNNLIQVCGLSSFLVCFFFFSLDWNAVLLINCSPDWTVVDGSVKWFSLIIQRLTGRIRLLLLKTVVVSSICLSARRPLRSNSVG